MKKLVIQFMYGILNIFKYISTGKGLLFIFFRAVRKVGINNGGTGSIGSSLSELGSSGGLLSGG